MATTTLTLTAAVRTHGGALPLFSGAIAMDGLRLDHINVEPQIAAYRRMVRELAFDVCELAPTTYLCAKAFNKPFTAIPVFLTRDFHHRSVVCNVASGIKAPRDLLGKNSGCGPTRSRPASGPAASSNRSMGSIRPGSPGTPMTKST